MLCQCWGPPHPGAVTRLPCHRLVAVVGWGPLGSPVGTPSTRAWPLGSGLLAGGEGTAGPALTACRPLVPGVQEKLGVMNKGVVYALWGYEAQNSDELSFHEGDAITILRRKDESETEWWWARLGDREGYVPKNLLGVSTGSSQLGVPRSHPCPTGPESTEPAGDPLSALSATSGNGEVP